MTIHWLHQFLIVGVGNFPPSLVIVVRGACMCSNQVDLGLMNSLQEAISAVWWLSRHTERLANQSTGSKFNPVIPREEN